MNDALCDVPNDLNTLSSSPPGANGPLPAEVQRLTTLYPCVAQSNSWLRHLWEHADLEPFGAVKRRREGSADIESTVYIDIGSETTAIMRDLDTLSNDSADSADVLLYELFSIVEMRFFVPEALRSLVFANLQSDCLLVIRMPSLCWTNGHWTRSDVLTALTREIIAASNGFGGLDNYLLDSMASSIRFVLVSGFIASLKRGELAIYSSDLSGRDCYGNPTRRRLQRFNGVRNALVLTQLDSNGNDGCIGVCLFAPNDSVVYSHWPSLTFLIRIPNAPPEIFSKEFLMETLRRYYSTALEQDSNDLTDS